MVNFSGTNSQLRIKISILVPSKAFLPVSTLITALALSKACCCVKRCSWRCIEHSRLHVVLDVDCIRLLVIAGFLELVVEDDVHAADCCRVAGLGLDL